MNDPFRGEVCAAWLDYLSELGPDVLQEVMQFVAEGIAWSEKAEAVAERTRCVYLPDLSHANSRHNHPAFAAVRPVLGPRQPRSTFNQGAL